MNQNNVIQFPKTNPRVEATGELILYLCSEITEDGDMDSLIQGLTREETNLVFKTLEDIYRNRVTQT